MNSFNQQCYQLIQQIPKGYVTTYKEIATALGTKAYRAVGNAMASNEDPITYPCYKVVKTNGEIGNYALGVDKKRKLLEADGIIIKNDTIENLKEVLWKFTV